MQDLPSSTQLQLAAQTVLQAAQAMPADAPADERLAFQSKIALRLLGLVERELNAPAAWKDNEIARLQALLGTSQTDLEHLTRMLCQEIAQGHLGLHTPGMTEHLRITAQQKLAIDQPTYKALKG